MALFAGLHDTLATLQDVRWTRDQMPEESLVHYEEIPGDHFTFAHGLDMTYFEESVIDLFKKYHPTGDINEDEDEWDSLNWAERLKLWCKYQITKLLN